MASLKLPTAQKRREAPHGAQPRRHGGAGGGVGGEGLQNVNFNNMNNNYNDDGSGGGGNYNGSTGVSDYNAASTGEGYVPIRGGRGRGRGGGRGGRGGERGGGGAGDGPICRCGEPKKLLTTTKPGPNQGREFYTCPQDRDRQCGGRDIFQWADSL